MPEFMFLTIALRCLLSENEEGDFPGGPVVKNPSCNAGDAGSIPGWGTKILHAAGQLSPSAATTEPTWATTTESTRSGAHTPQLERSPSAARKDPECRN